MIRIAACDESEHVRSHLLLWIREWMETAGIEAECFGVTCPEGLEYECEEYGCVDLVFAEVEFGNGADKSVMLKELKDKYPATDVVIVTKRGRPYRTIFDMRPFGCLEKPVDKAELANILKIYIEERRAAKFYFRYNRCYYVILVDHIIYIYHFRRKIEIYCTGGQYFECYMRMEEAEERLASSDRVFLRIRDSCMVNMTRLTQISSDTALMEDGTRLPVSRSCASGVIGRFSAYFLALSSSGTKQYRTNKRPNVT